MTDVMEAIKQLHRERRFYMKLQQKIDRALESYVRRTHTDWKPEAGEEERTKANKLALDVIKRARKLEGDPNVIVMVSRTDKSRAAADEGRKEAEHHLEQLAESLPAFGWVDSVRGAGALGLATIIGEAGDLSKYANPAKLWKRLGFAPFEGCAGSTWKRDSWRPRALTRDEWIDNPFSGERYALIITIGTWLVNAQIEGKKKSETEYGRPKGSYGKLYVSRREHTAKHRPDWTPMHAHRDAVRVVTKRFLADLWTEWRNEQRIGRLREAAE